ncbi:GNAT family N-acetyltransferase [uncultured Jatrophihabitans sp.]|uniref:GNAT family N-acetyltransferase n=1 Tax=uncultured Jatrophihabitans sp. TaxID=1610747 RepID=UPI0035CAC4C2
MSTAPDLEPLTFRAATADDVADVLALVRLAYRGPESRRGWTSEAELLDDERIDTAGVLAKITAPSGLVLLAAAPADPLVACCELVQRSASVAYFGMFAVRPAAQSAGLGRVVLAEAERHARTTFGVSTMEMTVIGQRVPLIEWYLRRGYVLTGEHRPFPYDELVNGRALRDDLYFEVLSKTL